MRKTTGKSRPSQKKKPLLIISALLLFNLFLAQTALSQTSQTQIATQPQTPTQLSIPPLPTLSPTTQITIATQQINPGNFGISNIPGGFNFPAVDITSPGTRNVYYIAAPETNNNYLEIFDGRYNGGLKVTVQVTPHVSGTDTIPATRESVIVSNFSSTQEIKGSASQITASNFYYYSESTPNESSNFHAFPEDGILVLMDAPTNAGTQGRVGKFVFYPSFKLSVPDNTPAGTYTSTITYTIEDSIN